MLDFYGKHNSYSIKKIFTFFIKEENNEKLEDILSKRVDIKNSKWSFKIEKSEFQDILISQRGLQRMIEIEWTQLQ